MSKRTTATVKVQPQQGRRAARRQRQQDCIALKSELYKDAIQAGPFGAVARLKLECRRREEEGTSDAYSLKVAHDKVLAELISMGATYSSDGTD